MYILINVNEYEKKWKINENAIVLQHFLKENIDDNNSFEKPEKLDEFEQTDEIKKWEGDRSYRTAYNNFPFTFELLNYLLDLNEIFEIYFIDDAYINGESNNKIMETDRNFIFKFISDLNVNNGRTDIVNILDNETIDYLKIVKRIYFPFIEIIINHFDELEYKFSQLDKNEVEIECKDFYDKTKDEDGK